MIISDKQYSEIQILTEDDELIADIADENFVVKSGYKVVFVPTEMETEGSTRE